MTRLSPDIAARATENADQALVARAAALLHTNGESTSVTLDAVERLNRGFDTRFTLLPGWSSVSVLDGARDPLVTVAPPEGVGMRTVAIAMRAIDAVGAKTADRVGLSVELERAAKAGPSPLGLFVIACATGPAALSIIFGAQDATAVLLVALSGALGGLVRRGLGRANVGPIGQVFAAAFLAGVIGGIAVNADLSTSLRLIAVCPAMILVPGPHILNGFLDLFALRIPLGFARLGYATVLVLSIGAGLALALALFGT
ncbi:MAG: threonine/serine exporter family protein, partial [Acidimicrobiia bacterium]